jgi:transposase
MGNVYTKEYREEAVKLAVEKGSWEAAKELGIPTGTVSGWLHKARNGQLPTENGIADKEKVKMRELESRIKELEKENARMKKENEFLEEASRFFAGRRQK